ncbi:MAG: hypothetical protein J6K80_05415 [Oscillospiraceae bacterium]|nr:hypothetical protein [Oscillospiraceae bacterium]
MEIFREKRVIAAFLCITLAFMSFFGMAKHMTSTRTHAETIAALDEKKATVMELTAASTAASAAITLIPGDTATPIADKVADLSTRFLIVLCAIYLEKYLVIITGYASWYLLIPVGFILLAVGLLLQKGGIRQVLMQLSTKLIVLGLAIALVIPASVKVSSIIEETYSSSIQQTIDSATQATEEIESAARNTNKNGLNIFNSLQQGVNDAARNLEQILNRFMEAIAVMIVTSCVIPIVVLLFFWWVVKAIIGIRLPPVQRFAGYIPEKTEIFSADEK